jgi:hypothetical protein
LRSPRPEAFAYVWIIRCTMLRERAVLRSEINNESPAPIVRHLLDRLHGDLTHVPSRHNDLPEVPTSYKKVQDGETHSQPTPCDFRLRVHREPRNKVRCRDLATIAIFGKNFPLNQSGIRQRSNCHRQHRRRRLLDYGKLQGTLGGFESTSQTV